MEKPDVDQIDGLSPAISIDQKGASRNPRSTVGTVTEIYDHLRLLFARIGHPHCPVCGREIERQTVQQMVDQVYALPEGCRLLVLGPLIKDRKTEGDRVFEAARKQGFVRVRVDGEQLDLAEVRSLDKGVVVIAPAARDGEMPGFEEHRYSERYSCPYDGTTIDELEPRSFSFNSPHGACPTCTGIGTQLVIDPDLVIPDRDRSVADGALVPWSRMPTDASLRMKILEAIFDAHGWDIRLPVRDLPPEAVDHILNSAKEEKVVIAYRHERGENTYTATFEGLTV